MDKLYYRRKIIQKKEKTMEFNHVSVLLNECIDNLNIKPDGVYVDLLWVVLDILKK